VTLIIVALGVTFNSAAALLKFSSRPAASKALMALSGGRDIGRLTVRFSHSG
jgi:hypothetical protein